MLAARGSPTPEYSKLFEEGVAAGRRRDYARAAELFARVAGGSERHPQALLYLGRSWHALGELERAARALASYCRQRPGSAAGHLFLGRTLLALGAAPAATRELAEAVRLRPDLVPAHGLLGIACLRARRFDAALAAFGEALRLDPDNRRLENAWLNASLASAVRLFYRGQLVESARLFSSVLERRESSIAAHVYLARIFRELGREALALFHLDAACTLAPSDAALRLQRAVVLLALGRGPEAVEELKAGAAAIGVAALPAGRTQEEVQRFLVVSLYGQKRYREAVFHATRLLRAGGKDPQLHALVAESHRALGNLDKARNHYNRAIESDRESLAPRYGLLAVLRELGSWSDLASDARRLLTRSPHDPTAAWFLAIALAHTAPGEPETLQALQDQIRAKGPDPELMRALAESYERAGLRDLAEGWFGRTLKISPQDEEALRGLARVWEAAGRTEDLDDVYRRVLAVRPGDRAVRRRLVRSLLARERWEDAAPELERLLAADRRSRRLRTALAHCYRRAGRHADALVVLRDLLTEDPSSEELVKAALFCLDRLGARENAIVLAERYQRDHGERLELALIVGVLRWRAGSLEKAAEEFRRAAALDASDWRPWRNLGMVYRKMGVEEFARKFLATAERCRRASRA